MRNKNVKKIVLFMLVLVLALCICANAFASAEYTVLNPFGYAAEAGCILGDYYTYCADRHSAAPTDGTVYTESPVESDISDRSAYLERA